MLQVKLLMTLMLVMFRASGWPRASSHSGPSEVKLCILGLVLFRHPHLTLGNSEMKHSIGKGEESTGQYTIADLIGRYYIVHRGNKFQYQCGHTFIVVLE